MFESDSLCKKLCSFFAITDHLTFTWTGVNAVKNVFGLSSFTLERDHVDRSNHLSLRRSIAQTRSTHT